MLFCSLTPHPHHSMSCLQTVAHPIRTPICLSRFVFLLPCFLPPGSKITYRKITTTKDSRLEMSCPVCSQEHHRRQLMTYEGFEGSPHYTEFCSGGQGGTQRGVGVKMEMGLSFYVEMGQCYVYAVLYHNHISSHCTVASGQCHCCQMTMVWETGPYLKAAKFSLFSSHWSEEEERFWNCCLHCRNESVMKWIKKIKPCPSTELWRRRSPQGLIEYLIHEQLAVVEWIHSLLPWGGLRSLFGSCVPTTVSLLCLFANVGCWYVWEEFPLPLGEQEREV